jgi:dihydroxyacetone kinase DhaK subunit
MTWNGLEGAVAVIADTAIERRAAWDRLDAAVGDGDFGTSLARGFSAVRSAWADLDRSSPEGFLGEVGTVLNREMGGSSGPLVSVAFARAAAVAGAAEDVDLRLASQMLRAASNGIAEYGQSAVGDKTLLDALVPTVEVIEALVAEGIDDHERAFGDAADAAATGAARTRELLARRGRAVYSAERNLGAPDPGAVAVAVLAARLSRHFGHSAPDVSALETPVLETPVLETPVLETPGLERPSGLASAGEHGTASTGNAEGPRLTKKFLNDPDTAATEALSGLAKAAPDVVTWDPDAHIVRRAVPLGAGKVGLVSGGGSGHEPLHAGFVGHGMLTSVAPGPVFASPTTGQVLAATRAADAGGGVLQIVKNYTGDVLNFRLAAEAARDEGIEVASVLVDDDVAVDGSAHTIGRRGTGATVLVHKVAGALAEQGAPLAEVRQVAEHVVARSASFGIALTSCSPPGSGPILDLGADEIEIGVGIHGERGRRRDHLRTASDLVVEASQILVDALQLRAGDGVLGFVNGFGGTPLMELYLLFDSLHDELASRGITIARSLVGNYVTSLEMAGASFTLLALDDRLEALWDAPVHTTALRWGR